MERSPRARPALGRELLPNGKGRGWEEVELRRETAVAS